MRNARPLRFALGSMLLLPLCCGGLDTIEVAEESSATIPGATLLEQLVGDVGFGSFLAMDLSQSQELRNRGVKKSDIDSVRLTSLALTITDPPSGQDFTFLDSLEFYVESAGLPRKRIARGGPFAANAGRVLLEVEDLELAPYATAQSMNVTAQVSGRRPRQNTTVRASLNLRVDVNVAGAFCGG